MKKFSLKKKETPAGRVDKKIGGFSLKNKNSTRNKQAEPEKNPIFGDDDADIDSKKTRGNGGVVQLTNVEDLVAKEAPDKPLVIVPSKKTTDSIQAKLQRVLAKQAEREKREIEEREKELAKESQLGFGLNEVTKGAASDTVPSSAPSPAPVSKDPFSAEISQLGGEEPTDESYNRVPVSKFGLAMLRGMGWNEELEKERRQDNRKNQPPMLQRRAPLTGLGSSGADSLSHGKDS